MTFLPLLAEATGEVAVPLWGIIAVVAGLAGAVTWLAQTGLKAIRDERAGLVAAHSAHVADLMTIRDQEQAKMLKLLDAVAALHPGQGDG